MVPVHSPVRANPDKVENGTSTLLPLREGLGEEAADILDLRFAVTLH
jgi:hypothetical protein